MYLKTLKVAGFKSFADRTRLEFRPGVSVVVGPNGSGKSNLVDAIHWVLGSQAPRSLRTARMEDVIFAGTATRPALNRSEVTVVFDNNTRQLALDLAEVAITRRLYRDGSSDYEINGVSCRLLDITELLSDSGVGRHQHIIINQGQVDSILSAGPEEHRAVIEEAAGILKHKLRRERAQRRLERTDEDVLRLNDILSEVNRQMRPLKRQADTAERHQSVVSEVRSLTLYLAGEELRHLDRTLSDSRTQTADVSAVLEVARAAERSLEAEIGLGTRSSAELRQTLETDSEAAAKLETTTEQLRRVAQVAQERHRSGLNRRQGADERKRDLEEEMASLEVEAAATRVQAQETSAESEQFEARFRGLEDEERTLADQSDLSAEGALAVVHGEQRSLVAADDRDRRELEQVERRVAVVSDQIASEAEFLSSIETEIQQLDIEAGKAQGSYETSATARRREQEAWEDAQVEEQDRHLEVAAAGARREAIEAAVAGLADPETYQMVANAAGALGSVVGHWKVPAEWALAVDAALGPFVGAIAFDDGFDLENAVASLKAAGRGGLAAVSSRHGLEFSARLGATLGLEPLIDAASIPESDLAITLLGDVVVAEGWLAAWNLVQKHPHLRAVTPEGDLLTREGILVARPEGASPAMLEAATVALERAEVRLARSKSRVTSLRRQFGSSRVAERSALEALEAVEARLAGVTEARGRAKRVAAEFNGERSRLEQRREFLTAAIAGRQGAIERLLSTVEALEGEESERERLFAEVTERRRDLATEREAARAAWQDASRASSVAGERLGILQSRLQVVEDELAGRDTSRTFVSETDLRRLAAIERLARQAIEVVRRHIASLRQRQSEERDRLLAAEQELQGRRGQHARLTGEIEGHRSQLGVLAITEAEARVRREAVAEGLARDADTDEATALAAPAVEGDDLSGLLERRQAELRRMGPVNPLAAEEYRQLAERHAFMAGQLDDLERSRAELRQVMRALDEEIQVRFNAAFDEVAAAYEEYFAVLFPGGFGRMRFSDPSQPLVSGVEIEAQPMGKKVGNLALLSGGERSLAALAFLFGVFKARPSPFYILDEVEAALDDANLRRFLRLVDKFRGESQLILITHQQQTMEAADVLYGVTMEPGASSQVLSRDLQTLNF